MRSFLAFLSGLCLLLAVPLSAQRRPAFVVLRSAPIIEHLAATPRQASVRERLLTPEADSYKAALRAEKSPLVARMEQRGIVVDWQIETVLNAVLIQASAEDLAWLRTQPSVIAADFSPEFHRHLDAAASLISAPAVWKALGGSSNAGRGVLIGIIDSGIDQQHPMFADSGFNAPSGFPKTNASTGGTYTQQQSDCGQEFRLYLVAQLSHLQQPLRSERFRRRRSRHLCGLCGGRSPRDYAVQHYD